MTKRQAKVFETPELEIFAVDAGYDRHAHFAAMARHVSTIQANFAMQCVERWAMVAGVPDGEDSAGRQILRRMTPAELTDHACATTDVLFAEFTKRGWRVELPAHEKIEDVLRDAEDSN